MNNILIDEVNPVEDNIDRIGHLFGVEHVRGADRVEIRNLLQECFDHGRAVEVVLSATKAGKG